MDQGICPSCEETGTIGTPCAHRVCVRRGYHLIPATSYSLHRSKSRDGPHPMIGRRLQDYLIVGFLGRGGFGSVYAALQLPIFMPAAIKMIEMDNADPVMAATLTDKFVAEAQALAKLSHPNIVRLLKFGNDDGRPFMVMEFVPGARTLKDEIVQMARAKKEFDLREASQILQQTLSGLGAAHAQNIIHRDIKPENIMLQALATGGYFVRIVDFGLVKFTERTSHSQFAMGTPMYMAPEQVERKHIGPWTDLYSLGVVTFELLTGRRPYPGKHSSEILRNKLDASYNPCAQLTSEVVSDAARHFFTRALAIDPEQRFRDVDSFAKSLGYVIRAVKQAPSETMLVDGFSRLVETGEFPKAIEEPIPTQYFEPTAAPDIPVAGDPQAVLATHLFEEAAVKGPDMGLDTIFDLPDFALSEPPPSTGEVSAQDVPANPATPARNTGKAVEPSVEAEPSRPVEPSIAVAPSIAIDADPSLRALGYVREDSKETSADAPHARKSSGLTRGVDAPANRDVDEASDSERPAQAAISSGPASPPEAPLAAPPPPSELAPAVASPSKPVAPSADDSSPRPSLTPDAAPPPRAPAAPHAAPAATPLAASQPTPPTPASAGVASPVAPPEKAPVHEARTDSRELPASAEGAEHREMYLGKLPAWIWVLKGMVLVGTALVLVVLAVTPGPFREPTFQERLESCKGGTNADCVHAAKILVEGRGVPADPVEAASLVHDACARDHGPACFTFARLNHEGKGVPKDRAKAMKLYRKACELSEGRGCTALGRAHHTGRGLLLDKRTARALFEKGCKLSDPQGCAELCRLGVKNAQGKTDKTKTFALCKSSCDGYAKRGCLRLAELYASGLGVKRDTNEAIALYERYCKKDDYRACTSMGRLLEAGTGVSGDRAKAEATFKRACEGNFLRGCYHLAVSMARRGAATKERHKLLERACKGGLQEACIALGRSLLKADPDAARRHFLAACTAGHGEGCTELGLHAYKTGATGAEQKAHRYWRRGCDAKTPSAKACTMIGQANLNKAPSDAAIHLMKACNLGAGYGCYLLGTLYQKGLGVSVDLESAKELYRRSCQAKYMQACTELKKW